MNLSAAAVISAATLSDAFGAKITLTNTAGRYALKAVIDPAKVV